MVWIDYAVAGAYLVGIVLFGSYFARFQRTTGDYFLTDRSTPWWAICFTIVATETSTLTFIGVPAAAYAGNMTFLQLAAGYVIGRLIVSVLFLPAYFRGALVTSYQLLQQRFGGAVNTVAAGLFLITRSLADGIRLFATALVISIVTGVPVAGTVIVLGGAMILYTVRGGVAAVIWTDVVQMFIYLAGALVVFVSLWQAIPGGLAEVVSAGAAADKFRAIDWSFDPARVYTLWAGLAGGIALTLATHGTDQFLVQRLLSAPSSRDAARGLVLSGFLVFAQFVLFLFIGVMLFVYHQHAPLTETLGRTDEILPRYILNHLPPGAVGFIVAAIVAAALSPSLNAMAATTVNDFYRKYVNPAAAEPTLMRVSRLATILWGLVQLAVALAAQWMERSVLDAGLAVLSLTTGPVLGAFLLAVARPRTGAGPVIAGMVAGAVVLASLWWAAAVAWTWYALIGATVTCAMAVAVSMARRRAAPRQAPLS
jgi:SSS family transporter